jgi:integrase
VAVPFAEEGEGINRRNYLLVKEFLKHNTDIEQLSNTSATRYWFYLKHLLVWADDTMFKESHLISPTLPEYLRPVVSNKSGKPLARETWKKILGVSTQLFLWATNSYPKEFGASILSWVDTLRIPKAVSQYSDRDYVTLEEILIIANLQIDSDDLALRRDQAAASLLFLTGMRAGALLSLPLKALDIEKSLVRQWRDLGVKTKNGKAVTAHFLPISELRYIVGEWDNYICGNSSSDSPWYPPIQNNWGAQELSDNPPGESRNQRLNKRLRILFEKAQLPYKSAHKFRRGFTVYGIKRAKDIASYKAVSLNLGHSSINITEKYYATLSEVDVKSRIDSLTPNQNSSEIEKNCTLHGQNLSRQDLGEILIQLGNEYKSQ